MVFPEVRAVKQHAWERALNLIHVNFLQHSYKSDRNLVNQHSSGIPEEEKKKKISKWLYLGFNRWKRKRQGVDAYYGEGAYSKRY